MRRMWNNTILLITYPFFSLSLVCCSLQYCCRHDIWRWIGASFSNVTPMDNLTRIQRPHRRFSKQAVLFGLLWLALMSCVDLSARSVTHTHNKTKALVVDLCSARCMVPLIQMKAFVFKHPLAFNFGLVRTY